jgi:L-lactate dehydrogenase complex protein LldG
MSARDEVLARVRASLRDVSADHLDGTRAVRYSLRRQTTNVDGLVGLFAERVADYKADVRHVAASALPDAAALALRDASSVVVPADLDPQWLAKTLDVPVLRDEPPLTLAELDRAGAVLTGCAAAIAETGTIILDGGDAQGRRTLTLIPDVHVCVVRAEQIRASVPEAIAGLDPRRPLTFISGPSATSDIELSRVEGVHGPRTLRVILLDGIPNRPDTLDNEVQQ